MYLLVINKLVVNKITKWPLINVLENTIIVMTNVRLVLYE